MKASTSVLSLLLFFLVDAVGRVKGFRLARLEDHPWHVGGYYYFYKDLAFGAGVEVHGEDALAPSLLFKRLHHYEVYLKLFPIRMIVDELREVGRPAVHGHSTQRPSQDEAHQKLQGGANKNHRPDSDTSVAHPMGYFGGHGADL